MRFCWANYTLWAVIIVLGLLAMLSGCGARGPLELPPEVKDRLLLEAQQQAMLQEIELQRLDEKQTLMQSRFDAAYATLAPLEADSPDRREAVAQLYAQLREIALQPPAESQPVAVEPAAAAQPPVEAAPDQAQVPLPEQEPPSPLQQLTTFKRLLQRLEQTLDEQLQVNHTQETVLEEPAAAPADETPAETTDEAEAPPAATPGAKTAKAADKPRNGRKGKEKPAEEAAAEPAITLTDEEIEARLTLLGELLWKVDAEIGRLYLQDNPLLQSE